MFILALITYLSSICFGFRVNCEKLMRDGRTHAKIVTLLLKVVETFSWAQKMRNMQVYISTYNILKL